METLYIIDRYVNKKFDKQVFLSRDKEEITSKLKSLIEYNPERYDYKVETVIIF